jgi:hypothetical protein
MRRVTILMFVVCAMLIAAAICVAQAQTNPAAPAGAAPDAAAPGGRGGAAAGGPGGGMMGGGLMGGGMMGGGMMGGGRGGTPPAWIEAGYDDHKNMQTQLGIKTLRPGKSGNNQTGPGFDEATANDWMPTMPDALKMKDGTKVTTSAQWTKRRAEILEDFEREVYGRIPANVPKVTWEVTNTTEGTSGDIPTITKTLVGHVDNSAFPDITVDIQASFTIPAKATGPVPVLMQFGGMMGGGGTRGGAARGRGGDANAPAGAGARAMAPTTMNNTVFAAMAGAAPGGDNTRGAAAGRGGGMMGGGMMGGGMGGGIPQEAISHGWGYGSINPGSIQADSGGNSLRQGIIGLTNKGKPRKPEDWGSLRAWGWGVSKLIDYFEANPDLKVDPKGVGIEGVSRYGKAALVTQAFDPRVAVALVGSSGEGGAKLHRHDYGEAVENLTGTGEYHWMCGNFLKYGTKEFTDTSKKEMNASDLPVDSHELIALCAPRPCFISYGVPSGDPAWVDAPGSYRAGILASKVYEVLGKKGYGSDVKDWVHEPLPKVETLVGGELAFRQHSGGHTDGPNIPTFFDWISNYIKSPAAPKASTSSAR